MRLTPAIAIAFLSLQGPALAQYGGFSRQILEWQQECVSHSLYARQARRVPLGRFGISIEVPEDMDFEIDGGSDSSIVLITEIEGIALKRCNELAKRLHGVELPGRGVSTLSISAVTRYPKATQDEFVDAVAVLGKKTPIYSDGIVFWAVFPSPNGAGVIQVDSYDIGQTHFLRLLQTIRSQ